MNNILVSLKKFFTNKNTVTVLGVLACLLLLYFGYKKAIDKEITKVNICVATQTIQPRTLITDDMIDCNTKVPKSFLEKSGYAQFASQIIGKYTAINTIVPNGSAFYSEYLIEKSQLPDNAFYEVKEGERPYAMAVTTANTYGNSIFPGNIIDVYMKAVDENGQVMIGRFLEKVEVLAVKDSSGNNVFEDTSAGRTPATLTFGVPENVYILLKKAEYLKSFGVEIFPVPYGGTSPIEGNLTVGRQELVDFINSNTVNFYEEVETPVEDQPEAETE